MPKKRRVKRRSSRRTKAKPVKKLSAKLSFQPMTTLTYCTVAQVKDLITKKATYEEFGYASDAELTSAIETVVLEAEQAIDSHCRRTFKQISAATEIFDGEGQMIYVPKWTPIISVSKVEWRSSQLDSWSELTLTDFYVYAYRIEYPDRFDVGLQSYRITYTYGYASVPKDIESACVMMVANGFIQRRMNAFGGVLKIGQEKYVVPLQPIMTDDVLSLLAPYVRSFVA